MPARLGDQEEGGEQAQPQESKFGITVRSITQDMANRYQLPNTKGVIVQDMKPDGFGDTVGLSRGDIILEINKQPVNSEDDFQKIESQVKERPGRGFPGSSARYPGQHHGLHGRDPAVTAAANSASTLAITK